MYNYFKMNKIDATAFPIAIACIRMAIDFIFVQLHHFTQKWMKRSKEYLFIGQHVSIYLSSFQWAFHKRI